MIVHDHYAHCEEVKPLLDLDLPNEWPNSFVVDDSRLLFSFEFNQDDIHEKDGEILEVLSVHDTYVFKIGIRDLVSNKILKELLQEDDSITNLKLLIDPDILQRCLQGILVKLGRHAFIDTNHLFVNNSVERLKKDIFSQTYNLFNTNGAMPMNIFVRLQVANKHYYQDIQEYHRSYTQAVLRQMRLRQRNQQVDRLSGYEEEGIIHFVLETGQRQMSLRQRNQQVDRLSGFEDEVLQLAQRASMEMEQPKQLIGASGASIDALEMTKYRSEECKEVTCCSVCYEEFMAEEEIKKMPCSGAHIFHTDCIEKWLKLNHVCPVCRYQMPTDE